MRLKLDQETLGLSSLIEGMLQVKVMDCFMEDDMIYVVVPAGELGRAIGKGGSTLHRLQERLQKRVKLIEYRDNLLEFVRNAIYPLQVEEMLPQEGRLVLRDHSSKTKGLLIGRGGRNLLVINRAVQRFFSTEVVVE